MSEINKDCNEQYEHEVSVLLISENTKNDEELLDLLKEWDLENIYLQLRCANKGMEELRYLNLSDLEKLFPKFETIGVKAKFREKLRAWRTQMFCHDEDTLSVNSSVIKWIKESEFTTLSYSPPPSAQTSTPLTDLMEVLIILHTKLLRRNDS